MKCLIKIGLASLVVGCVAASAMAQDKATPMPPAPSVSTAPVIIGSGCCDTGCGGCNQCGSSWHPTFDVGFYILQPVWSSNPAAITEPGGSGARPVQAEIVNFDPNAQFVPKFSLGVVNDCGLGFRTTFWQFALSNTLSISGVAGTVAATPTPVGISFPFVPSVGVGTNPLITTSKLRMVVWDFEATQDFKACQWDVQVSGGIRYAHISQDYSAVQFETDGDFSFLNSGHNFNGAGPTASIEFARKLGKSGVALYANGRGSVLIGHMKQSVQSGFVGGGGLAPPSLDASGIDHADMVIPVGELEVGVRWTRDVGCSRLFLKAGLVGQAWFGAGNSTRSGVGTTNEGEALVDLSLSGNTPQKNDNLYLWGLNMSAGIRY
jgi:hypothetical protein